MSLIKCPDCGKQFSEFADYCPVCGYPTADIKAKMQNATLINNTKNSHLIKLSDASQEEETIFYQQTESQYDKGNPGNSTTIANVSQKQPHKKKINWKHVVIIAILVGLIGFFKGYIQEYGVPFIHSNSKDVTETNIRVSDKDKSNTNNITEKEPQKEFITQDLKTLFLKGHVREVIILSQKYDQETLMPLEDYEPDEWYEFDSYGKLTKEVFV